jgi:hypothetical protein
MEKGEVYIGYPAKDNVQELSKCIAHKAFKYSFMKSYESPFAKGAKEAGKMFMGGKSDDITVIVAKANIN